MKELKRRKKRREATRIASAKVHDILFYSILRICELPPFIQNGVLAWHFREQMILNVVYQLVSIKVNW